MKREIIQVFMIWITALGSSVSRIGIKPENEGATQRTKFSRRTKQLERRPLPPQSLLVT